MIASTTNGTDRIEDQVQLPQPRTRVWRALTTPAELGAWSGVNLAGNTIAPRARVSGPFTIPGHEHHNFDVTIETMEPEHHFAWRWHPSATAPDVDMSKEPRTLVTFTLEDARDGGTLLRVVENGFQSIAAARRTAALLGNTKGWSTQLRQRLTPYLASAS